MRVPRLTIVPLALTVVNLVLLGLLLARGEAAAQSAPPVVRARGFELVDARGAVRASLRVEADGDAAVVRLLDGHGTIRVKLAANADGSGLVLLDDRTELGIQLLAQPAGSSVRLVARDAGERLLTP